MPSASAMPGRESRTYHLRIACGNVKVRSAPDSAAPRKTRLASETENYRGAGIDLLVVPADCYG